MARRSSSAITCRRGGATCAHVPMHGRCTAPTAGCQAGAAGRDKACKARFESPACSAGASAVLSPALEGTALTFMSVGQMASSKPSLSPSSGTWVLQQERWASEQAAEIARPRVPQRQLGSRHALRQRGSQQPRSQPVAAHPCPEKWKKSTSPDWLAATSSPSLACRRRQGRREEAGMEAHAQTIGAPTLCRHVGLPGLSPSWRCWQGPQRAAP